VPSRLRGARVASGSIMLAPCRDGYICMMALEERQWQSWLDVMGRPDWADNPLFANREQRSKYWDALEPLVVEWTMQHDREEITRLMQAQRVPALPVNTVADILRQPQFDERNFFASLDVPALDGVRIPSAAYNFSLTPWSLRRPAPSLGQDNESVYAGELGLPAAELARLRRLAVI